MKLNKIYKMDALEFLRSLPDDSVDLVLTDPPYEISKKPPGKTNMSLLHKYREGTRLTDISSGFDVEVTLCEFLRVLKKMNMFIFCSQKQLSRLLIWGESRGYYTTTLVWHKYNSVPFANGVWRQDIEFVVHIREKGTTFQGGAELKQKVTSLPPNPSKYGHPTEKPITLIEKYIEIGSNTNDIILDPFMGSGTTAVAARNLDRNFIGSELQQEYIDIAENRLKLIQKRLF